jgi:hypothetical protein
MNIVIKNIFTIPVMAAAIIVNIPAVAQETEFLGKFGKWEAFKEFNSGKPVCYMGAQPTKAQGKYKKRGDTYVLVTHRLVEKSFGVVSVSAGYNFLKASETTVTISADTFSLFTDAGHAFAYDKAMDTALIQAMVRGAHMIIKGTSSRGTKTTDTYSLNGVSAAWRAINKACKKK